MQNWEEGRHFYSDIITKTDNMWETTPIKNNIPYLSPDYAHVLRHEQAYVHPKTQDIIEILGRWNNSTNPLLEARIWTRKRKGTPQINKKNNTEPINNIKWYGM